MQSLSNPSGCRDVTRRPRLPPLAKKAKPRVHFPPVPVLRPIAYTLFVVAQVVNIIYVIHEWSGPIPDYTATQWSLPVQPKDSKETELRVVDGEHVVAVPMDCVRRSKNGAGGE